MEYITPISQQFSFQQEQPPALNKNQRRLQLRNSLSSKTIPQISTFDHDEEHVILQKSRQRSSSVSSKASSNHSHYTSPFDDYEEFGVFQRYADDRSKPSTPVDDILPDASPLRLGGSAASTMRKNGRKGLRKASFYSEASTLVSDGFGDLMVLSSQSIVGPRFYESGSGSGSDHGGSKRERGSASVTASNKRRATARGKINMGNHHNIYTTPPRGGIVKDTLDHSSFPHMHPEDASKYIEDLEQQNQDLTAQLHNLTSPTSTASNVAKLKKLTQENRALKDELAEWETSFDDKVKEECRKRIIANEMDARARVRAMEQTLEETRETVKILHADINRLNTMIEEVAHERDLAEKEKREMELRVEVLTEMLRAREGEPSISRCSSRAGGRDVGGRYSQGSYTGSVMAALRRSGQGRPLSISSSQYEDSEGEENVGYAEHPSFRSGSPTQEPGIVQSRKRMTRSFERGSAPQPLVLPTTMGFSQPQSPNDSRPTSSHSSSHPISLYGGGMQANASNISIDSGRTPSVRSGMSAIVTGGNSLFAELSMLDDAMSDGVSHRDDFSEYSRLHSRVPSYTSFARQHHRGPSIITSPVADTPRIRSPTPIHSQIRSPIRSPILAASIETSSVPHIQSTSSRGIFSTLTRTSSVPLHLVAEALTRYKFGRILIAVGHGLRSPKVTLYKVKTKACEAAVKVLTGEMGVGRVSKKRRKVWNQRGNGWNEDRGCSRCSGHERGRKIGKSGRRSVSAPIPSRVSNLRLSLGTPIEGSREPSLAGDRSPSRRPSQHHRKRRVSTTSKQQGPEPVRRQHRVHAGDSVWVWVRFLMAIVVTLSVVGNKNEKENEKAQFQHDVAVTDDDDDDDEDNYSDYLEEVEEDEQDTLEIKVEKWRRERDRVVEANR